MIECARCICGNEMFHDVKWELGLRNSKVIMCSVCLKCWSYHGGNTPLRPCAGLSDLQKANVVNNPHCKPTAWWGPSTIVIDNLLDMVIA